MKECVIFGAGNYGYAAYYKLRDIYNILYYIDNNSQLKGKKIHGIPVVSIDDIFEMCLINKLDFFICTKSYFSISRQLMKYNVQKYYCILEGFVFYSDQSNVLKPCNLHSLVPYKKRANEKAVLYVQNTACVRTHKFAKLMKSMGYKIFLLYTMNPPEDKFDDYMNIYSGIYMADSARAILDFVTESEFDIIHSSNEPDLLSLILRQQNQIPIVYDCHDMSSAYRSVTPEEMIIEQLVNVNCAGVIYPTERFRKMAIDKYDLDETRVIAIENYIEENLKPHKLLPKISGQDGQIHIVYEGGISEGDYESDRFYEEIWKKIASAGIHIHFYAPCSLNYAKKLEQIDSRIHYEGNLTATALAVEMTKYDAGLCYFNTNERNIKFLESASPNKLFEYINSGIPIAVCNVKSWRSFVETNNVGMYLDLDADILNQITLISKIKIEGDFLKKNHLTFEGQHEMLEKFYQSIIRRHNIENH